MKNQANIKLTFIFLILLNLNASSQFNCNDILYNEDTLAVINDTSDNQDTLRETINELFSGYCDAFDKKGKLVSRTYIGFGVLDSVVYFDRKGLINTVEPYRKWIIHGTVRTYNRSGILRQSVSLKNGKYFGLWREYYKNGKIKYEADYENSYTTKNNSYYTWTRKGVKYLHQCIDKDKTKHIGKLTINSGYSKCKKIKVKDSN